MSVTLGCIIISCCAVLSLSTSLLFGSCTTRMRELELEDRQYEIDKELNELSQIPCNYIILGMFMDFP